MANRMNAMQPGDDENDDEFWFPESDDEFIFYSEDEQQENN